MAGHIDAVKTAIITGAVMANAGGPLAVERISASDADDGVKTAAIDMIGKFAEAGQEAAAGIREGEDAADSAPVASPEASDHADPDPDAYTDVAGEAEAATSQVADQGENTASVADAYSETDADPYGDTETDAYADADAGDDSDAGDRGSDTGSGW